LRSRQSLISFAFAVLASLLLSAPAGTARAGESDPMEGFNRGVWWFNDTLDRYLLEPIAVGWRWITPEVVEIRLDKAFVNLRFPLRFVNDLLQGDVEQAGREMGRFAMNSTVGIAGLFDPASRYGLELREEDFGQTFGVWGLPPGAFLMLPVLGPSGVRDLVGLPLDIALGNWPALYSSGTGTAIGATERINTRALNIAAIRDAREGSLDYYVFVRNAYQQLRAARVRNGEVPADEIGDDLYELDEDDDE
jgi:phospholipid-binding lipoprotein MlaA